MKFHKFSFLSIQGSFQTVYALLLFTYKMAGVGEGLYKAFAETENVVSRQATHGNVQFCLGYSLPRLAP